MHVRKAVISAAGRGARLYPSADTVQKAMLPVVDRDGLAKPVIQIIAEEALDSGIEEICVLTAPGDEQGYARQFAALRENLLRAYEGAAWAEASARRLDDLVGRISFAAQHEPRGYGHAVGCAEDFVNGEPFLLLLGDHLYISHVAGRRCAQQLIDLATRQNCAVAAVQSTREHLIGRYGTLSGRRMPEVPGAYRIETIIEKPSVSRAELELQTPGLRVGHYLCFFGMHVLTPAIFDLIRESTPAQRGEIHLTPALQELARRETYLALELEGTRYDIRGKFGLLQAQMAFAMSGVDRDQLLTTVAEALTESATRAPGPAR